jgi:hypothetical protein
MQLTSKFFTKIFLAAFVLSLSCNEEHKRQTLFELMVNTGINFENKVIDNDSDNCFLYRNFYNGGGVAIGDLNNDGLADVVLTSNMGSNAIYLNKGDFKFEDISVKSGIQRASEWCTGVTLVDINSDGWLDIYVCSSGNIKTRSRINKLYINNHDLTFTESAAKYGLNYSGYCTQATFFDYDMDGDLDCFIICNSPIPFSSLNYANMRDVPQADWKVASNFKGGGNHLFRNDRSPSVGEDSEKIHFTEVTAEAGIHSSLISFALGVSIGDINNDGYPDIYVGNDFIERDYLYINQKNGTFKDELEDCIQHTSMSSMSADIADINNDGFMDVFTTDMLPADDYRLKTTGVFDNIDLYRSKIKAGFYYQYVKNCLQLNNANGKFSEISNYSKTSATDWSWGGLLFDADNDGWNDIYVCNGINRDLSNLDFLDFFSNDVYQKMQQTGRQANVNDLLQKLPKTPLLNKAFRNLGNLQFTDAGKEWGFTQASFSNSVAYGDLDNDGDLDLIINNENQPAFVYKNNARSTNNNHYISVLLKGTGDNTFAIGSIIKVYGSKEIFTREVVPCRGFQSSVDYKQVIGIGTATKIDSIVIDWPNLTTTTLLNPRTDTFLLIQQSVNNNRITDPIPSSYQALLSPVKNNFEKHAENDYVDFYYERNIPQMLSREGPKATCGDVNGDGLEDVYICGAANQAGQLYLQKMDGTFIKKEEKDFDLYKDFEEVTALFFDCDGDNDLDLFVGSGGNNIVRSSRELQHRLYKNDGKGNFKLDANAFPLNEDNTSVAEAYDFDNDGDLDLFVGARSIPGIYGLTPKSHIYINDSTGHFKNMDASKMGGIDTAGMVTGAIWADINDDMQKELVIVGDWMYPHIFSFNHDHFSEIKTNLKDLFGWWRSVAAADVNGDGKEDLILGNIGENFYLHPKKQNPAKLWLNDFDGNGSIDKILTSNNSGKDMPVFLKHDMEEQIPSIKKQNLRHEEYAKRSIRELFPSALLDKSIVKQFNYSSSCLAINERNGNFTVTEMPAPIQFSCVNAIKCVDVNNDGFTDLILGGNQFNFIPQLQRLDASFGNILLNNGKTSLEDFKCLEQSQSGLQMGGEVRDIEELNLKNKKCLLFLRNNDYPVLYELKK